VNKKRRKEKITESERHQSTPVVAVDAPGSRNVLLWICLALTGVNILIYAQVRSHEFLNWDDPGSALDEQGRFDEAIARYSAAIKLDSSLVGPHNNIGVALLKQGRIEDAIREFGEAVRLDPGQADYHYNLAVALQQGGHSAEASQHLETTLKLNPQHQEVRAALRSVRGN